MSQAVFDQAHAVWPIAQSLSWASRRACILRRLRQQALAHTCREGAAPEYLTHLAKSFDIFPQCAAACAWRSERNRG